VETHAFPEKTMAELQRVDVSAFRAQQKMPVVVVLDNVRSMANVGSVFRTCDAFAVERLILCGYTPMPPHRDIRKTALGAEESVAWTHFPDTAAAIEALKLEGYLPVAVEQAHGSVMLNEWKPEPEIKIALVFGNEVEGVSEDVLALCDTAVEIPQSGTKHSLNIAVSVGVVVWAVSQAVKG
jgi:23S rRNA (guanosine2251-2'-O)-methyltransferase